MSQSRFEDFLFSLPVNSEEPCSYFVSEISSLAYFCYEQPLSPVLVDQILQSGFRRSGFCFYKTACENCSRCIGFRLPLKKFQLSSSQKRVLRKNKNVSLQVGQPNSNKEKEKIYLDYQYQQHFQKPMDGFKEEEFDAGQVLDVMYRQMYQNTFNSVEMELYWEDQLMGFAIFDIGNRGLSAVYSVFSPKFYKRSPGRLMILRSIEWAIHMQYQYYYLGVFIADHFKMNYKADYQPAEILLPATQEWIAYSSWLDKSSAE